MSKNVQKKNAELKQMNMEITNLSTLQQKVTHLEKNMASCKEQRASLKKNLNELSRMHDEIGKYTRKFNLEIHNVLKEKDQNIEQIILDLVRATTSTWNQRIHTYATE